MVKNLIIIIFITADYPLTPGVNHEIDEIKVITTPGVYYVMVEAWNQHQYMPNPHTGVTVDNVTTEIIVHAYHPVSQGWEIVADSQTTPKAFLIPSESEFIFTIILIIRQKLNIKMTLIQLRIETKI